MPDSDQTDQPVAPPRAFTQGVGTVFQFAGVILFVTFMFICCGSSLLGKEAATHTGLTAVGWHRAGDPGDHPFYSAQRAITICLPVAIFAGLALAAIGLGLQAQNRLAPILAASVTLLATAFWVTHAFFFALAANLIALRPVYFCTLLAMIFAVLAILAAMACQEMWRNPPPRGLEILPADYKVPYSHMHEDPPEVRLARELEQRRQKLAIQQQELQMLEEKLKRKLDQERGK